MKKIILLTIILFTTNMVIKNYCAAQWKDFNFPVITENYVWGLLNAEENQEALNFIKNNKEKYFNYFNQLSKEKVDEVDQTENGLLAAIHFLDLNKDGNKELIFNGFSGEEGNKTEIFQKIEGNYEKVFSTRQNIIDFKITDSATYLYILDKGCCAEYSFIQKIFKIKAIDNKLNCAQIYQSQLLSSTQKPNTLLGNSFQFTNLTEKANLRFAPKIDDTTLQDYDKMEAYEATGNIIAQPKFYAKGKAFAQYKDKVGTEWLYVEMNANTKFNLNKLNDREGENKKFPTNIIGWIINSNIQKMDNAIPSLTFKTNFKQQIKTQLKNVEKTQQTCLDKGIAMTGCVTTYFDELDYLLNIVYQKGMAYLENDMQKKNYKSDQFAWLKVRDASFKKNKQENDGMGSMGRMIAIGDNAEFVKKRILVLVNKM
jgi:uncharacterized protein YecT (DUF1311 family)